MKRFLLLRNNQELGPFSFEELRDMGLTSNDLLWVEGKSLAWEYPTEIDELKGLVSPASYENFKANRTISENYSVIEPSDAEQRFPEEVIPSTGIPIAAESFHSYHNEEPEQEHSPANPEVGNPARTRFFATYGVWLVAMVLLLVGTTWLIKKAVDVFSGKGLAQNKMTLVVAPLKTLPEGVSPRKEEDGSYQNAISREIVPVDTTEAKEPIKKKPKLKELKKYLQVESNDYKVGVFGGINNLQLTVINNSSYILDKVVLQVEYLKPKGESVETEKFTYFSIPPHGKKTLDIPPSKRGVKVKYKILDAKSREYKVALVQA